MMRNMDRQERDGQDGRRTDDPPALQPSSRSSPQSTPMTQVAILWHMHQPFYEDLATHEHILPWVRLHALKDYYGMVALLREFPDVKMTFNLVPSLLVQLEAFAEDRARDRYLELSLKPAADLTAADVEFILDNFFHAQRQRMIDVYPRYAELLARRGGSLPTEADRRAAAAPVHRRRPSRSPGLAQARLDRSVLSRRRRRGSAASCSKGARLHRRRQGAARPHRARAAEQGHPRISGGRRPRPDRALDLAVLPPDSAAAVRHGRLPAHAPGFADAAPAFRAPGGCARAAGAGGGLPRAAVRPAADGPVAVRRLGVGRDGAARRRRPASPGWRPTS